MAESNPNSPFAAALRGTLRIVENADPDSPLSEATADSVNMLLDEINLALAEGMPERITDDKLAALVDVYRAQAQRWIVEEGEKRTKARTRKAVPKGEVIEVEI